MQSKQSWLGEQAFGDDAGALVNIAYKSHLDALKFMTSVLRDPNGVGLLQGPDASGKTTTVRRFAEKLPDDTAIALVDGSRIKPRELLSRILVQFGYDTGLESTDELLKMVDVFAMQQTRSIQPPVLIVDNADRMFPSALRTLSMLARIEVQQRFAMRIILTGSEGLTALIQSDGMKNVAKRNVGVFMMGPLSLREALIYLHERLAACGVNNADTVFPVDVCDRLYEQSNGWPGLMDRYAREAIGRAQNFPLRVADTDAIDTEEGLLPDEIPILEAGQSARPLAPRIIISKDAATVADYTFKSRKVLIGRSDFADIVVDDDFVSKLHAVMLLYSDALVLLDLNSANGVTVNSVRVRRTILKNDDIISLGNHRLKVANAPAISEEMLELVNTPDTIRMKNLLDIRRRKLARLALVRKQRG
jgi:type II secretory pathway predicted ATPase ExeA